MDSKTTVVHSPRDSARDSGMSSSSLLGRPRLAGAVSIYLPPNNPTRPPKGLVQAQATSLTPLFSTVSLLIFSWHDQRMARFTDCQP